MTNNEPHLLAFFSELDDILKQPCNENNIQRVVDQSVDCAVAAHDQFLQLPHELAECCYHFLDSPLCLHHKELMMKQISQRALESENSRELWVMYHILIHAGLEDPQVFRWMKAQGYLSRLHYQALNLQETRLQLPVIQLLYEVCRVHRLTRSELEMMNQHFIVYLLEIVEHTRNDEMEELNFSVTKLLLALNEQYMLFQASSVASENEDEEEEINPILDVLAARPGRYKTFSESLVFLLNRASGEDPSLQVLILKLLYLLFTTPDTYDYFYTNDLHVLVDVVIRALHDLSAEAENLRSTYLRVLGPLLANTPLRNLSYKREEIRRLLDDLVSPGKNYGGIVSATTQRLVERVRNALDVSGRRISPSGSMVGLAEASRKVLVRRTTSTHLSVPKVVLLPSDTSAKDEGAGAASELGGSDNGRYSNSLVV
ncbi:uncharacterized protein VTP21DRAFT_3138 [Calcarisporiella thermophila]|uniref:uncharacterized protein n=1 Tax=Calcarisporiella thermophila TaxID=911321 RepID=UPI0037442552